MNEGKREKTAKAWIALQRSPIYSSAYDENFWASNAVWRMVESDPEECWKVILTILSIEKDDWILENLGAGPLEDLLVAHGPVIIDKLEKIAMRDPVFHRLAQFVWRNDILDDVWERLKRVASGSTS